MDCVQLSKFANHPADAPINNESVDNTADDLPTYNEAVNNHVININVININVSNTSANARQL